MATSQSQPRRTPSTLSSNPFWGPLSVRFSRLSADRMSYPGVTISSKLDGYQQKGHGNRRPGGDPRAMKTVVYH